jgi:hypothetical protein
VSETQRMLIDWKELRAAVDKWCGTRRVDFPEAAYAAYRANYLARLAPTARAVFEARWPEPRRPK